MDLCGSLRPSSISTSRGLGHLSFTLLAVHNEMKSEYALHRAPLRKFLDSISETNLAEAAIDVSAKDYRVYAYFI